MKVGTINHAIRHFESIHGPLDLRDVGGNLFWSSL